MNLSYRLPQEEDESLLRGYVQEHYDHDETSISASMGLAATPYGDWVEKIRRNAAFPDPDWGRSLALLCFDGDMLVGLLSIRYELPEELRQTLGDIGYGVRPTLRGRGYATEMLRYALGVCREKGMSDAILGCYRDNIPSARTIRKNHGQLIYESDGYKKGRTSQYYRIQL